MKKYDYSASGFHKRLFDVLKKKRDGSPFKKNSEIAPYWSKFLGVSQSAIRDSWDSGSYPGVDKIIKICQNTNISASYLLTGNQLENKNIDFKERAELTELKEEQMHILKKYAEALEENNIIRKEILKLKQTKREDDPEDFEIPKRSICSLIV